MTIDLVVARYQEDLAWLRRVPRTIRRCVYDKGGGADSAEPLANVGREAHTYLHHIVSHYDRLADLTVFVQGKPFDHVPDLHRRLRGWAERAEPEVSFCWLGFLVDEDDRTGSRLFRRWSKNPEGRWLDMAGFWREVFAPEPCPETFVFFGGANFAVTRTAIHRRARDFYGKALGVAEQFPDAAHCFERTWSHVFLAPALPPDLQGRPLPIYLKPIRRLMEPASDAVS
jgi:hypothetical protein